MMFHPSEPSNGSDSLPKDKADRLRLALPSDGDLYEPSLDFLRSCGIAVDRPNPRRYTARIPALPCGAVLFQRTADITQKVEEGSAELGITGLDRFLEYRREGSPVMAHTSKTWDSATVSWWWPSLIHGSMWCPWTIWPTWL